jgi:hypothetical protein
MPDSEACVLLERGGGGGTACIAEDDLRAAGKFDLILFATDLI